MEMNFDRYPSAQSMIDQQVKDVERAAIAQFMEKHPNRPFTCGWHQDNSNDSCVMRFTVTEMGVFGESEVSNG